MLPVSALKSMRVMFATPCYISAVTMNYVASIFSMAWTARISAYPASCISTAKALSRAAATRW